MASSRKLRLFTSAVTAALCSTSLSVLSTQQPASAQTVMGMEPVAPVQLSGSDENAQDFNQNVLPDLQAIVNANLSERQSIGDLSAYALNPDELVLSVDANLRAYFIGEGAGYRNTFGFYTGDSTDGLSGDASLIFPDASIGRRFSGSLDDNNLDTGDFVDLGSFDSGEQLNLFLIANGANGGTMTYFTDDSLNADGIEHFILLASPESSYMLIGAEDLYGGGDEDYNDLVVALETGRANITALISNVVPLPGPVFALFAAFLIGLGHRILPRMSRQAPPAT